MQTWHLKALAFVEVLFTAVLFFWGLNFMFRDLPDLEKRPIASWQPTWSRSNGEQVRSGTKIDFGTAQSNPLFRADRRPFVLKMPIQTPAPQVAQPPVPAPAPQTEAKLLVLNGISITPNGRKALLHLQGSPPTNWVEEGMEVAGWSVLAINPDSVKIRSGDATTVVPLYVDNRGNIVGSP